MSKARDFWRRHVEASRSSGVTIAAYAQRHGLKAGTLGWWRSELRREEPIERTASSRFVAVRVAEPTDIQAKGVVLGIGDHLRLELTEMPSPQWLAMLGQALGEVR